MTATATPTLAAIHPIVVCPRCRGRLATGGTELRCRSCQSHYGYEGAFPDLIVGGRFDDADDEARTTYEEQTTAHLANHYLIPQLRQQLAGIKRPRVLSLGCGCGADLDLLVDAGFDVYGIDCGNRSLVWPRRRHRDRFFLANGKHLPFENEFFHGVYCGCVFPHVGVEGDSRDVTPGYWEERLSIAREIGRVLRPGGCALVSSPNRLFPLDIFHGRTPEHPYPRLNSPTSKFLLSAGDYRALFGAAGCGQASLLPVKGYWGFLRMKQRWKGRALAFPVETMFSLVSQPAMSFLRGSPVNPWLVMLFRRDQPGGARYA
jgi:SAM-dependent methyltransferase